MIFLSALIQGLIGLIHSKADKERILGHTHTTLAATFVVLQNAYNQLLR